MTHILELDNISFSYRNDTVLDSVTFSVNKGDYIIYHRSFNLDKEFIKDKTFIHI